MSYDFNAELFVRDKEKIERKIDEFQGRRTQREEWMEQNLSSLFREILETKSWYLITKEVSLFEKYYEGRNDNRKEDIKSGYKGFMKGINVHLLYDENLDDWVLFKKPKIDTKSLPSHSNFISVTFTLRKPYISQDDEEFYVIDNPICKDKVFKVPLVRPSSWKGNLRFAALKGFEEDIFDEKINEANWKEERAVLVRLFGNEKDKMSSYIDELISKCIYRNEKSSKDVEEEFEKYLVDKGYVGKEGTRQGRLVFYPTFLDKIDLDVITPLERDTRTPARGPITFEVVPGREVDERGEIRKGAKGSFSLLYFPFDLIDEEEERVKKEVKEDLEVLKDAIPAMLSKYGFGAKTTAGYGVVEIENGALKTSFCWEKNFKDWNGFKEVINSIVEG